MYVCTYVFRCYVTLESEINQVLCGIVQEWCLQQDVLCDQLPRCFVLHKMAARPAVSTAAAMVQKWGCVMDCVHMSVHISSVVEKMLYSVGDCTAERRCTVGWWGGILY